MSFAEANASSARHQQHADMRLVAGGTFRMGSDRHYPEEASVHRVTTFKEYPLSQACGTLTVDEAVAMISHGAGGGK
jgi:formylglycine-generating enzyme required for sulfatase activity